MNRNVARAVGVLNDDSTDVGSVHLGPAYLEGRRRARLARLVVGRPEHRRMAHPAGDAQRMTPAWRRPAIAASP